jgi:hypothetical protein
VCQIALPGNDVGKLQSFPCSLFRLDWSSLVYGPGGDSEKSTQRQQEVVLAQQRMPSTVAVRGEPYLKTRIPRLFN